MTEEKHLKVGVLGCGPIAQAAHFESVRKSRNCDLYAICDVAEDLAAQMAAMYLPQKVFYSYETMLADPELDAVIIATSDAYHIPASSAALKAGKHVLCEKPLGVSVEEVEDLAQVLKESGKILQVGHMKRFDGGIQSAREFIRGEMGEMLALKAWYCDSTHRYPMTDAVQPLMFKSKFAKKPSGDPKANKQQYFMLTHGSHLFDTVRYLAGDIVEVRARLLERFGAYCWFIEAELANGALAQLDLTVAVRMDWHEGFHVYGQHGSVLAKTYNPWYYKSSEVDIFHEATASTSRVLAIDGHFYRRQLEAFADTILLGTNVDAAGIEDGLASVRTMVAVAESVKTGKAVRLDSVSGGV